SGPWQSTKFSNLFNLLTSLGAGSRRGASHTYRNAPKRGNMAHGDLRSVKYGANNSRFRRAPKGADYGNTSHCLGHWSPCRGSTVMLRRRLTIPAAIIVLALCLALAGIGYWAGHTIIASFSNQLVEHYVNDIAETVGTEME